MLMRWVIRAGASIVGLIVLISVSWVVHKYAGKNGPRERFREGIDATGAIRTETGREVRLSVELASAADDEQVVVTANFPDPPADPAARKELARNTHIIVRRYVHHVRDVKVLFDDTPEVLPSWDGGVAVAGVPLPIGMKAPPPSAAPPDAGAAAPAKAAPRGKSGTVTLVTFPDADVFRGKEKLGRTPLFNVELPVGTHLLTLVGADGAHHRLSMPVKQGKNKPMKMDLADLPVH